MGCRFTSLLRTWGGLLLKAHHRFRSPDDYLRFQVAQARLVVDHLAQRGICLSGVRVLDLGCGRGGYSHVMSRADAEVVSLDFRWPQTSGWKRFVVADALCTPFRSASFPFIFCASLIEHVPEPVELLREITRLLAPAGSAYVSFPPFYTPVGGHQFKPFHLLGEKWALRLSGRNKKDYRTCYGEWGLYPLSIREARDAVYEAGMQIDHESTRFLPVNLAKIPYLGEFLAWHVQFITSSACS